jgi:hypothetical protein
MIYMVEVENDDGVIVTREYDCASIVEALATANSTFANSRSAS